MGKQPGYSAPPWTFKGRALYQLQLVKLEEAKKYIPSDLNIVSFLGYTLGGFYLARYDDSPIGPLDECVALAGIVWNKPTSCAWAARVYVDDMQARDHGRHSVGLPSRLCKFSQEPSKGTDASPTWWDQSLRRQAKPEKKGTKDGVPPQSGQQTIVVHNMEKGPSWRPWNRSKRKSERLKEAVCSFQNLPSGRMTYAGFGRLGPRVKFSLPSYSGRTRDTPGLLRYALQLQANVRVVPSVVVDCKSSSTKASSTPEAISTILTGRPVLAIAFDNMEMTVQKPISVPSRTVSRDDEWQLLDSKQVPQLVA